MYGCTRLGHIKSIINSYDQCFWPINIDQKSYKVTLSISGL